MELLPMEPVEKIKSPASQFDAIAFLYDELMSGVPYRQWEDYLEQILEREDCSPVTILDLCCGTGSVSRLLAEKGYQVSGIDISAGMIDLAKTRSQEKGLYIDYHVQDAAALRLGRKFDLVVSLFDSLNYILESASLQQAFYRVSEHITPGGLFVFDVNTELALSAGLFNQDNLGNSKSPLHYNWKSSYDSVSRICRVHMDFIYRKSGTEQKVEVVHYQRAYEEREIIDMLRSAGLEVLHVYDAYTFEKANRFSDRAFYIARK